MKRIIIIPSRLKSSRLPYKAIKDIHGKPMIVRVCEAASKANVDGIYVAADDDLIRGHVEDNGYNCVMTTESHVSGTDRLHEAADKLGLSDDDIIINLQGDEPLMPTENLEQVCQLLLEHPTADVATLYVKESVSAISDHNIVKLVQSESKKAIYFSRAPIPFDRDKTQYWNDDFKRHAGIYAYRKSALDLFVKHKEGVLESLEKLEQLRFIENDMIIVADEANSLIPSGVDTQLDLDNVRLAWPTNNT